MITRNLSITKLDTLSKPPSRPTLSVCERGS